MVKIRHGFLKILRHCALEESSLSIGKVKEKTISGALALSLNYKPIQIYPNSFHLWLPVIRPIPTYFNDFP